MNINDFKKKVKNEEFAIPDVKEKVKESSTFKNREIFEDVDIPLIRNKNWFRISLSATIFVLVAFLTIVMFTQKDVTINYESSAINYLKSTDELKELINYENDNESFNDKLVYFVSGIDFISPSLKASEKDEAYAADASITDGDVIVYYSYANTVGAASDTITSYSVKASSIESLEVSKTNTQVENVDEADIVKSDGKKIYRCYNNYVLINKVNDGNIDETEKIDLENAEYCVRDQEMYLTDDYLVLIYFSYKLATKKNWYSIYYTNRFINVKVYDKETLEIKKSYKADYVTFNESRLVNGETDVLYLVFNQSAYKDSAYCEPSYYEDEALENVNITEVCYFDNFTKDNYTYIVSIKLDETLELNKSVTLGTNSWNGIYATEESMYLYDCYSTYYIQEYLADRFYDWTEMSSIVKYSLENGVVTPIASLATEGEIISQFALDEYNGYLRLVSSIVNNNKLEIYKLGLNENQEYGFTLVGSITKGLGEENEEIKSVDFNKDECIVVTAKQTDPMYKIDLSDPTNPTILGKFKEDGYNSYLQYLTGDLEGLAIGLGYITHDISDTYNVKDWTKFALYDVKGADPVQLDIIEYGTSYMEACEDHKALFVYKNYIGFEEQGTYHVYEVVKDGETYKLEERIAYEYDKDADYYYSATSRMYYINGYFYLTYIDEYSRYETSIVSFDSNFTKLNEVNYTDNNAE